MRRATSDAELHVYGAWALPDRLRGDLPPSIHFHGAIPQSELFGRYAAADILVFPTLCDGFGMVVTEAFAHGLPVITTDRAGAADIVRHGENGLIVTGGDVAQLAVTMDWCVEHRAELSNMRLKALETAGNRPWLAYRDELAAAIASTFGLPRRFDARTVCIVSPGIASNPRGQGGRRPPRPVSRHGCGRETALSVRSTHHRPRAGLRCGSVGACCRPRGNPGGSRSGLCCLPMSSNTAVAGDSGVRSGTVARGVPLRRLFIICGGAFGRGRRRATWCGPG